MTDQGKSFENQLVRELCSLAQVQKLCTTPYQPKTNVSCEHFNYTMMSIDVEFGVALPDISHASQQNYAEKLQAQLKWAYKATKENDHEAVRHKKYYDQKFKCIKIVPGDLVLVRV